MKNNLFISSNAFNTIISSIIIEEKHKNDNNILLIVANHLDTKFFSSMINIAENLKCFSKILFYNEYSDTMKLNKTITVKDAKNFNFKSFEKDAQADSFENIYATFFYMQSKIIIDYYPDARIKVMENGTASYLPQNIDKNIANRILEFYSLNYFNLFSPAVLNVYPAIKNIVIEKEKIKEKFETLSNLVKIEKDENAVIFCAHNLSLNKSLISESEEFDEYINAIKKLLAKGYTVYFKEHPKTPAHFYNKLRTIKNGNVKVLKDPYPVEIIIPNLKPQAIVSVFSSSLLTVPHIFDIPSYTFKLSNNLSKFPPFKMAYSMILSYIAQIDSNDSTPISNINLSENPVANIIYIDILKYFINKKTFLKFQKNIQTYDYEIFEYLDIPKELYEIYKYGSYLHLLIHYTDAYTKNLKECYNTMQKKEFIIKTFKTILEIF